MSHIQKAKEIMASLNKDRNKGRDPTVWSAKKDMEKSRDSKMTERVGTKQLTEVDRFKFLQQIKAASQAKRKAIAQLKESKSGKVKKRKNIKQKVEIKS